MYAHTAHHANADRHTGASSRRRGGGQATTFSELVNTINRPLTKLCGQNGRRVSARAPFLVRARTPPLACTRRARRRTRSQSLLPKTKPGRARRTERDRIRSSNVLQREAPGRTDREESAPTAVYTTTRAHLRRRPAAPRGWRRSRGRRGAPSRGRTRRALTG